MDRLLRIVGLECKLGDVVRELYGFATDLNAPVVGAMQLTCSDESERECMDAFQSGFAEPLLPSLKFGERSVFRIANLGARYETGAIHIAEQHYSAAIGKAGFKLLLAKVNSHVSVELSRRKELQFGSMKRYGSESLYCGALHAFLDGADLPFARDLREHFGRGGLDRLAMLLDESRVERGARSLFIALTEARLQVERLVEDFLSREPETPTLLVALSAVTLNRRHGDSEIVCGVHRIDRRESVPKREFDGLGDDPSRYRLGSKLGRVTIEDS